MNKQLKLWKEYKKTFEGYIQINNRKEELMMSGSSPTWEGFMNWQLEREEK